MAVIVGIRWNDWNTTPMWSRRKRASASSFIAVRSWPRTVTDPPVAVSSPPISIRSEDLPDPDGPTRPSVSPRPTRMVTPRRMLTGPALPSSVSVTSLRAMTGSDMGGNTLGAKRLRRTYGAVARLRNFVLAAALGVVAAGQAAAEVTILAFGDSLTQGYGLPEDQGFVPQLQRWLDANGGGDVTLINGGVSGDTTAGGLSRIAWSLDESVDGVIVALGGNDVLRGLQPSDIRANLDGILTEIDRRGLPAILAGLPAPSNYGKEYQTAFKAIFPELAEKHGAIYYKSFLGGLGDGRNMIQVMRLFQADGLHPNAEGVSAIVEHIGPVVLQLAAEARE